MHHALPDLVREQGLDDAERARDDGDPDHPRDEQVEQAQVVLGQRGVEDGLDQEGRYGAEHRGEDDQAEDAAEPEPVRPEEGDDAPEVRAADRRVRRPLRRILVLERAGSSSWHETKGTERGAA